MMMDYPCGKFGDCSFSRFGSVIQTDRQTDRHTQTHTHTHTNQTEADEHISPATLVGTSNKLN